MKEKNQNAQNLAKMRKTIKHSCLVCGKTFEAIIQAKVCGNACRCKLYRQNKWSHFSSGVI